LVELVYRDKKENFFGNTKKAVENLENFFGIAKSSDTGRS